MPGFAETPGVIGWKASARTMIPTRSLEAGHHTLPDVPTTPPEGAWGDCRRFPSYAGRSFVVCELIPILVSVFDALMLSSSIRCTILKKKNDDVVGLGVIVCCGFLHNFETLSGFLEVLAAWGRRV